MKTLKKFLKNYRDNTLNYSIGSFIFSNAIMCFICALFISLVSVALLPNEVIYNETIDFSVFWNTILIVSAITGISLNNFLDYLFYVKRRKNNLLFKRRVRAERKNVKINLPMDVELKLNFNNPVSGKLEEYYIIIDKKSVEYYTENENLVCWANACLYNQKKEKTTIWAFKVRETDKTFEDFILRNSKIISEAIENLTLEKKEKEKFIFVDKD